MLVYKCIIVKNLNWLGDKPAGYIQSMTENPDKYNLCGQSAGFQFRTAGLRDDQRSDYSAMLPPTFWESNVRHSASTEPRQRSVDQIPQGHNIEHPWIYVQNDRDLVKRPRGEER